MANFNKAKEQLPLSMGITSTGKRGFITGGNNVKMVATEIKAQKKLFGDYVAAQKLALFGEGALGTSSSTKNERNKKDKPQKKKNKEKKHAPKVVNEESKEEIGEN